MKKSSLVSVSLVAALAAVLTGCDDQQAEVQTCVDQNNVVQDEAKCQDSDRQKAAYGNIAPHPVPYWWYYHWMFGGRRSNGGYRSGSTVIVGGRMTPTPGMPAVRSSVVTSSGAEVSESGHVSYGGFGEAGAAHAVGGEGGGE